MCNEVHKTIKDTTDKRGKPEGWNPQFRKITETGTGYKLFNSDSVYSPYFALSGTQYQTTDGDFIDPTKYWVVWNSNYYHQQEQVPTNALAGFCFFKTKKEATEVIEKTAFYDAVIAKISYSGGLGSFFSYELDGKKRRFYIATSFKIIS